MTEVMRYVYRHYDEGGGLLYIGLTSQPKQRLAAHKRSSPWGKSIARVELVSYEGWDNWQKALDDEAYAIAYERPKHNRTFNRSRVANVARVRVLSCVRLGSGAKSTPEPKFRYFNDVKYIRADAIGVRPAQIRTELNE